MNQITYNNLQRENIKTSVALGIIEARKGFELFRKQVEKDIQILIDKK